MNGPASGLDYAWLLGFSSGQVTFTNGYYDERWFDYNSANLFNYKYSGPFVINPLGAVSISSAYTQLANTGLAVLNGVASPTSTSTVTIPTYAGGVFTPSTVTFTTQTGLRLAPGQGINAWPVGQQPFAVNILTLVLSYNSSTGVLVLTPWSAYGSGSYSNWVLEFDNPALVVNNFNSSGASYGAIFTSFGNGQTGIGQSVVAAYGGGGSIPLFMANAGGTTFFGVEGNQSNWTVEIQGRSDLNKTGLRLRENQSTLRGWDIASYNGTALLRAMDWNADTYLPISILSNVISLAPNLASPTVNINQGFSGSGIVNIYSGLTVANGGGQLTVGSTTPSVRTAGVYTTGDALGFGIGPGAIAATGGELTMGYFATSGYGYIQAVNKGTAYTPLIVNPLGGGVAIGTTSPTSGAALTVAGNVSLPYSTTGGNKVTGWTNYSGPYNYDTFTSSGANITSAIDSTSNSNVTAYSNSLGLTQGTPYLLSVNLTLNSGQAPSILSGSAPGGNQGTIVVQDLVNGQNNITFFAGANDSYIDFHSTANTNYSAVVTLTALTGDTITTSVVTPNIGGILQVQGKVSVNSGRNTLYYCSGTGFLARGNSGTCSSGSWTATSLMTD